jgi:hypothetical protein
LLGVECGFKKREKEGGRGRGRGRACWKSKGGRELGKLGVCRRWEGRIHSESKGVRQRERERKIASETERERKIASECDRDRDREEDIKRCFSPVQV